MDFLTFKDFISIPVLIGFYYLGAVVMPIFMWLISFWLGQKFTVISNIRHAGKEKIWQSFSIKQKILFIAMFIVAFLFMELFWRILFEYLIAYMQMRDALLQ